MPSSLKHGKAEAKAWFASLKPVNAGILRTVDVGPGIGTYRTLMADVPVPQWWLAVEVWKPYIRQYNLEAIYDAVVPVDIRCFDWDEWKKIIDTPWDVAIFGDVLEHMAQCNALSVVAKARAYSRHVLISVPVKVMKQGESYNNPFEAHVHHWSHEQVMAAWPDAKRIDKFSADRPNATRIGVYVLAGLGWQNYTPDTGFLSSNIQSRNQYNRNTGWVYAAIRVRAERIAGQPIHVGIRVRHKWLILRHLCQLYPAQIFAGYERKGVAP